MKYINRLAKPRLRGESDQEYLERIFPLEEDRILYWQILTKELYKKEPNAVVAVLESLEQINPEAHKIVMDKYNEIRGVSK